MIILKSGLFLYYSENWLITNNYIMKGDGTFRNASLVSPMMYLVALTIGKSISKAYQSKRQPSIDVFYAGNYDENRLYYKKDYDVFFKTINVLSQSYKYFIKTDIKDFFPNIDMNKLFDIINQRFAETGVQINQKDLLVYKELLLCLGQGEFPLIENCAASSYLATVVYLEIPDAKLYSFITDKELHITGFTMVRYVDDLYILFNSDLSENMITPMVNRIVNAYSSELKKLNLSLNRGKTSWKLTADINEELKKSLYDEQFDGKECNITDFVDNDLLLKFLGDIKKALFNYSLDAAKYLELINEVFNIPQTEYTPQEIYNSLVYEKHTLFSNKQIIEMLFSLVCFDYNFLKLDTKRLTIMLLRTQNGDLIKAMLSKLFEANRRGVWNIYDTSLAINYLLQRNFNHVDLLRILKHEESSVHSYYEIFCKSSFLVSMDKSKQNYIRKFGTSIFYKQDDKLFFLYFMYMVEMKKSNYLSAFAYYKNFFDRISAHLGYTVNGNQAKGKPNYKGYYKEGAFKQLYAGITDVDKIIEKAHEIRNSNPLSHSSAELLDKNNSVADILNSIEQLSYLIESKIEEYQTDGS
ncbi:MAG TPA: AbiA family abortive infection protein [Clostridiales bacterium]|nr:AbiA family abortive infection protein [Clostridiales bacterium]